MKLFAGIEKTIERGFRKWTEHVFGPAESDALLLIQREILEAIESKVQTVQRGRQVFPYNHVTVRLASADAGRRGLYQMAFAEGRRLESDIREALAGVRCEVPAGLTVDVETMETGERTFEVHYEMRAAVPPKAAGAVEPGGASAASSPAPARLTVVRGKARQESYPLTRPRLNIGRIEELTDAEQRLIRRNDIIFDDGADEINATVSRRHGHIRHDAAAGEYRVVDEGSELGTRIFRDGRAIDVPSGNRRGERLRPGDEVYFGRACLRFDQE